VALAFPALVHYDAEEAIAEREAELEAAAA
jgi:hypothetical protein